MQDILAEFSEGIVASPHDEDTITGAKLSSYRRNNIVSFFDEKGVFTTFFDLSDNLGGRDIFTCSATCIIYLRHEKDVMGR